jgi:hypothetical protein
MPPCMPPSSSEWFLVFTSPAVAALCSAIALWVASRARSTSRAVASTSEDQERALSLALGRPTRSVSRPVARGRKKSLTKATTSTQPSS